MVWGVGILSLAIAPAVLALRQIRLATVRSARDFLERHPRLKNRLRPAILAALRRLRFDPMPLLADDYRCWIELHDAITEQDRNAIRRHIEQLTGRPGSYPLISVVMPVYETPEPFLLAAIASVRQQLWPHWELCIADDASPSTHVGRILAAAAAADPRIKLIRRERNGHIAAATNSALSLASGQWVALLDHDDILAEQALYEVAVEATKHPQAQVIYSDEDRITEAGQRYQPYFKPDFDPDLLLGQNLISHLGVYRRSLLEALGGVREGFDGSQDHDLALCATAAVAASQVRHIPAVLYHWRHAVRQASFSQSALTRCIAASRRAVAEAAGAAVKVGAAYAAELHTRVTWPLPDPAPKVSVIVTPEMRRPELLRGCLAGLLERTDYEALEVLVTCNSGAADEIRRQCDRFLGDGRLRVLPLPMPWHIEIAGNAKAIAGASGRHAVINQAVAQARGEIVVLMDGAVEAMDGDWLKEMVGQALRREIGAVGAKLISRSGKVRHGGLALGMAEEDAGRFGPVVFNGAEAASAGPFGQLALVRTASAVSGLCLAVKRSLFNQLHGFDATYLTSAAGDIDFCLRLSRLGLRNLWTPFATLRIADAAVETASTDPASGTAARRADALTMRQRWGEVAAADPYWNPNLSLVDGGRVLAATPRRIKPWMAIKAATGGDDVESPVVAASVA